jgi:dTMP kinase
MVGVQAPLTCPEPEMSHSNDSSTAHRPKGIFLAFEGCDGSGKTTQARLLADSIRAGGRTVVQVREPGGTAVGERIRGVFQMDLDLEMPPETELFLLLASRAALVNQVIRPALDSGCVVVADRFELSTLAYQGAGRGLPIHEIRRANALATGGLAPDVTFVLSVDPSEGERRQEVMGKSKDRMEAAGADFHRRVAAGYDQLSVLIPGAVRVGGQGSVDEVQARISSVLAGEFPEFGQAARPVRMGALRR